MPSDTPTIPPDEPPRRPRAPGTGIPLPPKNRPNAEPATRVESRESSETPSISPQSKLERAVGRSVLSLVQKHGIAVAVGALLSGGAGLVRTGDTPEKVDAVLANVDALRKDVAALRAESTAWRTYDAKRADVYECRDRVAFSALERLGFRAPGVPSDAGWASVALPKAGEQPLWQALERCGQLPSPP